MERSRSFGIIGVIWLACSVPAFGHGGEDHSAPTVQPASSGPRVAVSKETQFLLGIRTERVATRVMASRVRSIGRFVPVAGGEAEVAPVVTGRVVNDAGHPIARLGDRVEAGTVLAVLEQLPAEQFALDAAYHEAKSELDQAEKELARHRQLEEYTSYKQLQEAETKANVARAAFRRVKREMSLYRDVKLPDRTVHRAYVRSPITGAVVQERVVIGEHVSSERWLFRVVRLDTLWVETPLYEGDLSELEGETTARIRTTAYPDLELDARLVGLSGEMDPESRTTTAVYEVANPEGKVRSGMFADVYIEAGSETRVLTVPVASVVEAGGRQVVYVHTEPEAFEKRVVVLGHRSGDYVAVLSGLSEGERVVTAGVHQIWSQDQR